MWAARQSIHYGKPLEDSEQGSNIIGIMLLRITVAAVSRNDCGSKSGSSETSQKVSTPFGLLALLRLENKPGSSVELVGIRSNFLVSHIRESATTEEFHLLF